MKIFDGPDSKIDRLVSDYEKELILAYKRSLKEFKEKLARIYERYGDDVTYQDVRIKSLMSQMKESVTQLTLESQNIIKEAIKQTFGESYTLYGEAINTALNTEISFASLPSEAIKASIYNPLDKIKWTARQAKHSRQLLSSIRREVTQGLVQGKGYPQIARAISQKTGIAAGKAIRITRTETHRVQSEARQKVMGKTFEAAEKLGLKARKVWISKDDGRSGDRHHERMNGKSPDDKGFYTLPSGVKTKGPGLSGEASEDINCRCSEGVEFEGL